MDLSVFERIFALRDEARKARLGGEGPDLSSLGRVAGGGRAAPLDLPDEKLAADLMARAVALREQATKSLGTVDSSSREVAVNLLQAASAPLRSFDAAELDAGRASLPAKGARDVFAFAPEAAIAARRPATVGGRSPTAKAKERASGTATTSAKKPTAKTGKKSVPKAGGKIGAKTRPKTTAKTTAKTTTKTTGKLPKKPAIKTP
jgi:hypothetical protein